MATSRGKSIEYGWFKDKTTSKLVEFIQKLLHFTKRRGLPIYFLPQPSNIFKKVYLLYLSVILLYFDRTFLRKSFKLERSRVLGVKLDIASIFDSL